MIETNLELAVFLAKTTQDAYAIYIGGEVVKKLCACLPKNLSTLVLICDNQVKKYYGLALEATLKKVGYRLLLLSFPAGEAYKNRRTKARLEDKMLEAGCDRDSVIVALGGGVVGDLAGFIAATYLRGIAYFQIPTTLLAMVDSSVGGKTGLNSAQGKNLIGAFWQPSAVFADLNFLKTLPRKQIINGLIEALKIFLTCDRESLDYFEKNIPAFLAYEEQSLKSLLYRAVKLKIAIVQADERERQQRVLLNFGHTIGHALEQLSGYQFLHGYAVALGILVEAKLAQNLGFLAEGAFEFIEKVLKRLDIDNKLLEGIVVEELLLATQKDKKRRGAQVHYVLLKQLGAVHKVGEHFAHPIADAQVTEAFLGVAPEKDR